MSAFLVPHERCTHWNFECLHENHWCFNVNHLELEWTARNNLVSRTVACSERRQKFPGEDGTCSVALV